MLLGELPTIVLAIAAFTNGLQRKQRDRRFLTSPILSVSLPPGRTRQPPNGYPIAANGAIGVWLRLPLIRETRLARGSDLVRRLEPRKKGKGGSVRFAVA